MALVVAVAPADATRINAEIPASVFDTAQSDHRNERSTPRDAVLPKFSTGRLNGSWDPGADTVRLAKAALMQRGYYVGRTDGRETAKFKAALFRHQRASGLTPTGSLDAPTLLSLGLDSP